MLSVCMLKNKPSKCLVILFYNFQQVQYIFVTLYIVLRAKIFENFLEFKLVELHNNLDKVCICQLMWQGKESFIIALDTVDIVSSK